MKNCLKRQDNGSSSAKNSGMESLSNTMVHLTEQTKKIQNSGVTPSQGHFRHSKLKLSSKTQNLQACHSCGKTNHS